MYEYIFLADQMIIIIIMKLITIAMLMIVVIVVIIISKPATRGASQENSVSVLNPGIESLPELR